MADADYFLDLSSSPDPLADGIPTSVRPASRRTTKSQQELSSFAPPQSSPRKGLRTQSPRKRTFQLNVGDGESPHRIRVTIEAEDALKRDSVHRKLFPPSATKRTPRRRETITTTTVPLNDEAGAFNMNTPPKRGRQRRTSNGTPMPRGRKRAGTPIKRTAKHQRQEDDAPSSDAGMLSDASADMGGDVREETPKPRTRIRKTPNKPSTSVLVSPSKPSSSTAGKQGGRSRKAPISTESDVLDAVPEITGGMSSTANLTSNTQQSRDGLLDVAGDRVSRGHIESNTSHATLKAPPRRRSDITSTLHLNPFDEPPRRGRKSDLPASSHQNEAENDDLMTDGDFQGMEPHSDTQSEESEDEARYDRQDTIADASEFSMIAVDSLPSFQASFQESVHGETGEPPSDQSELGDETSRIINDALETLRRSLQTETSEDSHATGTANGVRRDENRNEGREELLNQSTVASNRSDERALSKSPDRLKPLPLSRQVFIGRGNVDDSFSTIPDSILHAATPGRLPMKPTASEQDHHDGQIGAYDDSFSEIPEEVLEAATPKPPRREERLTRRSPAGQERNLSNPYPSARMSNSNYGSGRLPTPDETSSSNAGSKKTHDDEMQTSPETQEHVNSNRPTDVPSSPPLKSRHLAPDYGPSNLQPELNAAPERQLSSPQQESSSKMSSNQPQPLDPPHSNARPSLSPIVRVGRTLQNVMSDNSSPEAREGSLRSPFKGSTSSDHLHQPSIARSPSPSIRNRGIINKPQPSVASPIRLDRALYPRLEKNSGRASPNLQQVEDPSGRGDSKLSRTESQWGSGRHQSHDSIPSTNNPNLSMTSSTRADPPTDDERSSAVDGNSPQKMSDQQASMQITIAPGQSTVRSPGTNANGIATTHDTGSHSEHDDHRNDKDMDNNLGDKPEADEHDNGYDDEDDDMDVWDIEASRTSPIREESVLTAPKSSRPDSPPSRRNKVPSPWRRNNRRLIFQDDIASSSQIEIEESSPSEIEERPPVRSSQQPASQPQQDTQRRSLDSAPVEKSPVQRSSLQNSSIQRSPVQRSSPIQRSSLQRSPIQRNAIKTSPVQRNPLQTSPLQISPVQRSPVQANPVRNLVQTSHVQRNPLQAGPVHTNPVQKSFVQANSIQTSPIQRNPVQINTVQKSPVVEGITERNINAFPVHSDDGFEGYTGPADLGETDDDELVQYEELGAPERPQDAPSSMGDEQMERGTQQKVDSHMAPVPEAPIESSEYSLLAQHTKQTPNKAQEEAAPGKSKFFGAFDILSFFSSPASLPRLKALRPKSPAPAQAALEAKQSREPPKGFWSTGLFPSIPSNESRLNAEQRSESFSPDSASQSSNSEADMFEHSTTVSTSRAGPVASTKPSIPEPSTPEDQVFPPIPQERDSTPRQGVSRSALFAPSQTNSGAARGKAAQDDHGESSDEQDSSGLTEGSEYERVPPRAKPSQWDRNLSPTKSCFRSPLKPTAPGRVVAFSNNLLFPPDQTQTRNLLNNSNNSHHTVLQGPPLQPRFEDIHSASLSNATRTNQQSHASTSTSAFASASAAPVRTALSHTSWSKQHWIRLEEILRLRRYDPLRFQQECPLPPAGKRRSSTLLGKEVTAHGATVTLEPWHLDVIEAFRREVGIWDDRALAKRIFALVVGAQRRRAAAAASSR
ncbi:hypothetical protein GGS21DRAFT_501798 [Xylaria nigripes]|nr:hypothetical protein GGS21DRAFT_501798 [Xylaria nigripes]